MSGVTARRLDAVAGLLRELGGTIIDIDDDHLGVHALAYAGAGWEVFPLRGKVPMIAKRDGGNGVLDATADAEQVARWWRRWPDANIGGRVPAGVVVVDIDPRNGGDETWRALIGVNGTVATRKAVSGRGDGGGHIYLRHPAGAVRGTIGEGLDVKTHGGYTVLPPSIHPDTGGTYRWVDPQAPIATPPPWLAELLRRTPAAEPATRPANRPPGTAPAGESPADWYTATHTWNDVLAAHGWSVAGGNGDDDGSQWRHPAATHPWSATIRHGLLFVYTPNTPFEATTGQDPHGYTRFRAYAVLEHAGNLTDAARAARTQREAQ